MDSEQNPRFLELATKSAAGRCSPDEQRELDAILEAEPNLREELEGLRRDLPMIKETLVMIRAMEAPEGTAPIGEWKDALERFKKEEEEQRKRAGAVRRKKLRKVMGWILLGVLIVSALGVIRYLKRPPTDQIVGEGKLYYDYGWYAAYYVVTIKNPGGPGDMTVNCTFSQDGKEWVQSETHHFWRWRRLYIHVLL